MSNLPAKKPRDLLHITASPTDPLRVTLATSPQDSTLQSTTETTITLLTTLFSSTRVHKDRFIYALAGYLFTPTSPTPFGGSKTKPGYISFHGQTPAHLLHYILKNAYKVHYTIRQSKSLKLVVSSVNRVLDLHMAGRKDEVDELMLKGVKKAGHCDWFGVVRVPAYLKHVGEEGVEVEFVGFVPPSVALGMRGSKSGGDDDGRRRKLEPMGMCGFLGVVMDVGGEVSNKSFTQSITDQPSTSETNAAALHEYVKKQEKFQSGGVSPQRCHQEGAESNGAAHHPICPTTRLDH